MLKQNSSLKSKKAISDTFTIKIEISSENHLQLEGALIDDYFASRAVFWNAVKKHKELFNKLPIKVSKGSNNKYVKIGLFELYCDVFGADGKIVGDWKKVFKTED